MLTFVKKSKLQVNHKDGNKSNNKLENLEYMTCKENHNHATRIGLRNIKGSSNGNSKLKIKDVWYIYNTQISAKQIAKQFKVTAELIYMIRNKKAWRWIHE